MTFESAMKRLLEISERLNDPEITLDEATELFLEAHRLRTICAEILLSSEERLKELEQSI